MSDAYRKKIFDELSEVITKLKKEIQEKQTELYYLEEEQAKQAAWFIDKINDGVK